ncbi:gamma-glutamyltranspeptidase/glutathione hydrolase [Hydrogenophaga palleronii]|uniref:Gamma-glutamyltranspeptidase/glutathione hydrolase n=1 Tax=Hydrogenophaga palleronii TaxID=65655 RepID=A0ABU1WIE3_9BURK|nr:gamma-glutamyltransferase family protein [Hydrogenophaga palleronii]MDR7149052.1 gamma-glutamyltranspeptidase/glutathione hydrolase [Hydrogenophaga palleronii]
MPPRFALSLVLCGLLLACAGSPDSSGSGAPAANPPQPEGASAITAKPGWVHRRQAVAAANPLAAEAGANILRSGGSAVDAAIAVQMVLTLVEPQSSGIGGGAFLLHHDGQRVQAFDGRETAPAAATEALFLNEQGQPLPFAMAVNSGRAVGVPGAVAMLAMAHKAHGRLPWDRLFEPAISLADKGFAVSQRLHSLLKDDATLRNDSVAKAYFYRADGTPHPVGHVLRNPELAHVLRQIAAKGPAALHEGAVAQAIVEKVQQHASLPGHMNMGDLQRYQPRQREALCHDHAAAERALRICGFPPPSSGAIAVGQILGLLSRTPSAAAGLEGGAPSADWLHHYAEASRLAFADRAQYVADPDFVAAPGGQWLSLLAPAYLDQRAKLIGDKAAASVTHGRPGGATSAWAPMPAQPEYGTSHISIVDAQGNALSMTTTIEAAFGARLMVTTDPSRPGGFLLNNQLTDFSFAPRSADGRPVANRVEPGKRPRSSMSPTLVFDRHTGELLASAGSPGGAFIIHFTAKTLHGMYQWGLTPQAAIDLPNFGTLGGPLMLETGRFPPATVQALEQRGHEVREAPMPSGLQAIQRDEVNGRKVWLGGADPRREGIVSGN